MLLALAAAAVVTLQPAAAQAEVCQVMTPAEGGLKVNAFPALKLQTLGGAVLPPLPVGGGSAVRCERSAIVIGPQDYRVITQYQMPLLIASGARTAVLETFEGKFRFRMIQGELAQAEVAPAQAALNIAQSALVQAVRLDAAVPKMSPASRPAVQRPR